MKEAAARIKINKLLDGAGWRFFAEGGKPANVCPVPSLTIKASDLDVLGANFEKTSMGLIDFLLLDSKGFPLVASRRRFKLRWLACVAKKCLGGTTRAPQNRQTNMPRPCRWRRPDRCR